MDRPNRLALDGSSKKSGALGNDQNPKPCDASVGDIGGIAADIKRIDEALKGLAVEVDAALKL